jgi:ABC-type uncharacterized transport system substrate-binding protein
MLFGLFAVFAHTVVAEPLRILHVMSYHAEWQWNKDQLEGFKSALQDIDIEFRVVELDTKRYDNEAHIEQRVAEAVNLVETWLPDLIYTNDDTAQQHFSVRYVGNTIPIVFSGVNRDPSEYDFLGAQNVTGVLEQEHFPAAVKLLRRIQPGVRKIAVIVDNDPTWKGVMARVRSQQRLVPNVEITDWVLARTYADYQDSIQELQSKVDAIAILGVFNLLDENGDNVDYEEVLKWTTENSRLPDFSFWQSRVQRGTLCAVKVSGFEQGRQAGQLARHILLDGVSPSTLPIRTSTQGRPAISLARARALGLKIDAELLLNTDVEKDFAWNR